MKNSIISIFIFIVLLGFLFYTDVKFKNLCNDTISDCDLMEYEIKPENKDQNFKDAMTIFRRLDEKNVIPSIYINHLDYDVILNEALKLSVYIEQGDITEAEASLHLLKFNTQHLKELQSPNLKNIF